MVVVLASLLAVQAAPAKTKNPPPGKVVDSGTFEIVVDGKRVGTETFNIQDHGATNVTSSLTKVLAGTTKAEQSATLEMSSAGELIHYDWKELSPGKATSTVEVSQNAVVQHIVMNDAKKPVDLPYMTAPSTMVLDDNFFSHRQLLVWRYLRGSCGTGTDGKQSCTPAKLGVLIPAQHLVAVISLELVGNEKMNYKGAERDVTHLKLMADDVQWDIWTDPADSYKILRIYIPSNKTEVVRN